MSLSKNGYFNINMMFYNLSSDQLTNNAPYIIYGKDTNKNPPKSGSGNFRFRLNYVEGSKLKVYINEEFLFRGQ